MDAHHRVLGWTLALAASALLPCSPLSATGNVARAGAAEGSAGEAQHGSATFQISGVVVDAYNGSPIPFARLQATPVVTSVNAGADRDGARTPRQTPGGGAGQNDGATPPARPGGRGQPGGFTGRLQRQQGAGNSAMADAHGQFVLTVAHAGGWRITAAARGYRAQALDEHENFSAAVVLSDAAPTFAVRFGLTADATVSGIVLDEAGEPVEHAIVIAELLPGDAAENPPARIGRITGSTGTDDRGHYEVTGLAPGNYRIHVQATPWYAVGSQQARLAQQFGQQTTSAASTAPPDPSLDLVYEPTWFPGTPDERAADVVALHVGEEREADFHLTPVPAAHLQLSIPAAPGVTEEGNRRGQPSAFQQNILISRVDASGLASSINSLLPAGGQPGVAESGGLPPGTYEVRTGPRFGGPGGQPRSADSEEVREIEIKPGMSGVISLADAVPLIKVTLAFDGAADAAATGVVFTNVQTGRQVYAENSRFPRIRFGPINDGDDTPPPTPTARTVSLAPGRYRVALQSATAYLTGMTATGAQAEGRTLVVSDGSPTVTLHTQTGRGIVGGVVQAGGKPLVGAMVVLVPATLGEEDAINATYRDESNTDGSFLLSGVLPGRYILIAIDHGWDVRWNDPATLAKYLVNGTPMELKAGSKTEQTIAAQAP
jgi:hypothetical protein